MAQNPLLGVILAAKVQNNWVVRAASTDPFPPQASGLKLSGVVMFARNSYPFADRAYGTAVWVRDETGTSFHSGHYDLSREDAYDDLAKRAS